MLLSFKKPSIEDMCEINDILKKDGDALDSWSTFGTLYLWTDGYDLQICIKDGVLFKKTKYGYHFPKGIGGPGELKDSIEILKMHSKKSGKFILRDLLEFEVAELKKLFPNKFSYLENRNDFEYIYSIKDLAELKGKKYHSKRNHISKFGRLYNWEYTSNLKSGEMLDFFEKWFKIYTKDESKYDIAENFAIKKAIKNFEALNLFAGALKVDGRIIACTIGEKLSGDVLLVHFEKAFSEFEGSYAVINSEFCKNHAGNFKLVNREEDLGIEGLRKAKLSYRPKILLKKYTAVLEE